MRSDPSSRLTVYEERPEIICPNDTLAFNLVMGGLVVLDESFAELDPDSLQHCLPEAADLAKSLLLVAHA